MATTIPAGFLALLAADTAVGVGVAALATGGIVGLHATGAAPITTATAPAAFATDGTSGVVTFTNPTVVISTTGDNVVGPANSGVAEWIRVAVYCLTYAESQAILARIHTLCHEEHFTLDDGRSVHMEHVDTPWRNQIDDRIQPRATEFVAMEAARYMCTTWGGKTI